jgi:hypothetical protein
MRGNRVKLQAGVFQGETCLDPPQLKETELCTHKPFKGHKTMTGSTWGPHDGRNPFIYIIALWPSTAVGGRVQTDLRELLLNAFRTWAHCDLGSTEIRRQCWVSVPLSGLEFEKCRCGKTVLGVRIWLRRDDSSAKTSESRFRMNCNAYN